MANNPLNTDFFDKAAHFAIDAHAGTERRGHGFPYVLHVMEAASIVASMSNDPELLAAAVLHDTIEDCGVSRETLQELFSKRVADLVAAESDNGVGDAPPQGAPWKERKEYALKTLASEARDAKMVALGDKLSNMRAIALDYREQGDALWKKFHAPADELHEWHYRGLAEALKELDDTAAYHEFVRLIDEVFSQCYWNK